METSNAYQSIYDGPSIDEAIARATEGGHIDASIQSKPNPNLLDNPNFSVNQRGNTSAPASPAAYIVDRWKTYGYSAATVSVLENGHISMIGGNASDGSAIRQIFEKTLPSGTYTLSVKVSSCSNPNSSGNYGILYARKGTTAVGNAVYIKGSGVTTKTFTVADGEVDGISIGCVNTSTIEFEYAKLELGSQQTLAHKDANGNWVLNEIPDYGEQLRRCQRYFVNFNPNKVKWFAMPPAVASTASQAYSAVTLPVAMRAQPVVSYGGNIVLSQSADHAVTNILVSDNTFTGNSIQLRYDVGAGTLTANSLYRVQGNVDPTSYIWLSADL